MVNIRVVHIPHNWAQLAAYIAVVIIAVFGVIHTIDTQTHQLYKNQLSRCQSGNVLRRQINTRFDKTNQALAPYHVHLDHLPLVDCKTAVSAP